MDHVYPPGPATVPPNLTAATTAYKHRAWLAMAGLAAFIALYFALSGWFAWTAWRLFDGMFGQGGHFDLWQFVAAVCSTFLAVFMLKALFFIQHRFDVEDIEITRQDQPQLFDFIDRLADEARAPRAHKVYLSARVNAAVFYDLSLLNLIVPSKKNLEIGLGLVNVVTLGELKAVLAHEFGHFAQRSMAVGRWVYISQQIAGHVVARRDALDKLLQQLSRFDLRIAWVGWILSVIVWSIRSMMDVLFRGVLLAQRALSRQMEFQADLVAVSLTGSDALIHALHKLNAADDAWDKALSFANSECRAKRGITDLFAVQNRIIERMREILNQPLYGQVPPLPATARDSHRVFKTELAQPPRMWGTHPPSADRENNAKQRYVAAPVDERSAWEVFRNPQGLKEQMSAHVFREATVEPTAMEKTFQHLEKQYGRAFLNRAYRGVYLHRSPVRYAGSVDALYGAETPPANLARALDSLYPEDLANKVELLNEKLEEKHALEALRDQVAQAPGGIIRHNGAEIRRTELPRAIASLEREIMVVRGQLETHDKLCRSAHLSAARVLEKGWPEYLRSLAAMLHYADHTEANLRDVQGFVANIYGVVTADGRVSSKELNRLLEGCQQLYAVLSTVHGAAKEVTLDRTLLRRLEVESWDALLEEFKLPPPNRENIGQWLNVIDGWTGAAIAAAARLRDASLEQLL
ncbi:MAG TPA: M48 family metallopeptidase, partial [Steroidobacteraceae bacterium]